MKDLFGKYLWWTQERGSFHYDVMVTLILLFIFLTPHLWSYRDRPTPRGTSPAEVLVKTESPDHFLYQINATQLDKSEDLETALLHNVEAISGDVVLDRYEAAKDSSGKIVAYRVWAHR
ncbi:hypothetical protein ACPOL_1485 [Acidisarcina polymorpha]|uniref:Uncharacterized protein n=1 Tax=Acidisarcina polymorpha TaxID=2211140 RepID=A0A2Z5FVF5_9BACT|nr:hypothetical protein [Acidisarcina polymorpha]AXC10831.1 hypothetical protein ACPOL_1485 [Acidisarcina polymorpha]